MAGTQLRHLAHEFALGLRIAGRGQGCFHLLGAMAGNHHHLACLQLRGRVQHMLDQTLMRQLLQHFRRGAFHAGALAGSHDDDVDGLGHGNNRK